MISFFEIEFQELHFKQVYLETCNEVIHVQKKFDLKKKQKTSQIMYFCDFTQKFKKGLYNKVYTKQRDSNCSSFSLYFTQAYVV